MSHAGVKGSALYDGTCTVLMHLRYLATNTLHVLHRMTPSHERLSLVTSIANLPLCHCRTNELWPETQGHTSL